MQEISARKELVCAECGKPLRECPPPKKSSRLGLIIGIAVIVVVACAIGAYFLFFRNIPKEETTEEIPEVVQEATDVAVEALPTDTIKEDSISKGVKSEAEEVPSTTVEGKQTQAQQSHSDAATSNNSGRKESTSNVTTLVCGRYEGPMSNGTPNGIGGTVYITRNYTISLKDGTGGVVEVSSGDKIVDTKFKEGVLQQGQLIRANGERKYLSGLAEQLQ